MLSIYIPIFFCWSNIHPYFQTLKVLQITISKLLWERIKEVINVMQHPCFEFIMVQPNVIKLHHIFKYLAFSQDGWPVCSTIYSFRNTAYLNVSVWSPIVVTWHQYEMSSCNMFSHSAGQCPEDIFIVQPQKNSIHLK
jgi:hypothetical protein